MQKIFLSPAVDPCGIACCVAIRSSFGSLGVFSDPGSFLNVLHPLLPPTGARSIISIHELIDLILPASCLKTCLAAKLADTTRG